jgi:hypothetical protein
MKSDEKQPTTLHQRHVQFHMPAVGEALSLLNVEIITEKEIVEQVIQHIRESQQAEEQ